MSQGTTKGIPIDKDGTLSSNSDSLVASQKAVKTYTDTKQPLLVSATNIKTVDSETLLSSGNISVVGDSSRRRMIVSGSWINIKRWANSGVTSGTGLSTSTIFFERIDLSATTTFTDISLNVMTASAGATIRMAIYSGNDITNLSLVSGTDTGDISAATTGDKTVTYASPVTLTKGTQYWRAIKFSSASIAVKYSAWSECDIYDSADTFFYPSKAYAASYATAFPSTVNVNGLGQPYSFFTRLKVQ